MKRLTIIMPAFIFCLTALWILPASASFDTEFMNTESQVSNLNKLHYLPVILPVIIDNRDVLELTDAQIEKLMKWRETNRGDVLYTLQRILHLRSAIESAALMPSFTPEEITLMQDDIFQLQRKVLDYKLSCRKLVFKIFNQRNWEDLMFVLAEQGMAVDMPMALPVQH